MQWAITKTKPNAMLAIQEKREGHVYPQVADVVRVTAAQYAERRELSVRRIQVQCKKVQSNPKATIDGYQIETYGSRYLIVVPKADWENMGRRPERKKFEYDKWLKELREKRREESRQRIENASLNKTKHEKSWDKFCLTPMTETWESIPLTKAQVSEQMAEFIKGLHIIEIPRGKHTTQIYSPRFHVSEELGEVCILESDKDFSEKNLSKSFVIPVSLIPNHFWLWRNSLVFFERFNPDGSPCKPRICYYERETTQPQNNQNNEN